MRFSIPFLGLSSPRPRSRALRCSRLPVAVANSNGSSNGDCGLGKAPSVEARERREKSKDEDETRTEVVGGKWGNVSSTRLAHPRARIHTYTGSRCLDENSRHRKLTPFPTFHPARCSSILLPLPSSRASGSLLLLPILKAARVLSTGPHHPRACGNHERLIGSHR